MRPINLMLSAACLALAAPAIAGEEVTFGPPPEWARISEPLPVPEDVRGVVFTRYQDSQVYLDDAGQLVFSAYRVKLLHTNALQLGNIQLAWKPTSGTPVVHWLKLHRDGAVIDVLESSSFEVIRREDQLEQAMLDGVLTAVLRIPDLRVDDEIELAYTLPGSDPTLGPESSGILLLISDPPPGRFNLRLSWEEGQEPGIKMTPDLEPLVTRSPGMIEILADNPEAIAPAKDAPPRYNWKRILEYSDFPDWEAISRRFAPLYAKASSLREDSPLKEEAARIAAAHPDAAGRAAAALKLVQQQVRYIYVGLAEGNLTPATADETWERRYGDCKAKTALLLALLAELGVPAEAVLANNFGGDDGLDARLPNPGMFDHVLVRATIDGEKFWLDGTLPPVIPAIRDPIMPYRWVLPLSSAGTALERLEWQPMTAPDTLALYEIDARAGFDQPATITQTSIARGPQALVEYYQYSSASDSQLENAFRQQLEGETGWDVIDDVEWHFDTDTLASVLVISGSGPVDWEAGRRGSQELILPGGGFNPPGRRQRGSKQDQEAPFYRTPEFDCRVTTVRIPDNSAEKDWSFNSTFDDIMFGETYRRSFERRDGALRMIRSTRTLIPEISPQDAAKDNSRLAAFDNSMARIYYDPGSADFLKPGETVRATYEGDWVADASACLEPVWPE